MLNLDTHIFLHALLGTITKTERALLENSRWGISSIVIWEITKLYQLGRITLSPSDSEFKTVLSGVHIWPMAYNVHATAQSREGRGCRKEGFFAGRPPAC
jgi:PIN domain nuclease of toxin-antitoxin system